MYDIIIRFPNKELADKFCGEMSDGFGEDFCDFSFWEVIKKGATEEYRKVKVLGLEVYFVNEIFDESDIFDMFD